MKKTLSIFLLAATGIALLLWFFNAHRTHPGLVLLQSCESAGRTWTTTTMIAGDHARIDVDGGTSTLFDLTNGDTTVITHPSRSYTKFSLPQMVARTRASMQDSSTAAAPPQIDNTGKSEKVGDYNAGIYTAQTPAAKFTCWITKDFPNYAAVNAQLKKYRDMEKSGSIYPDLSGIDGLMVKSEIALTNGRVITITLVSAKLRGVYDSMFLIPSGYVSLPAPAVPVVPPQEPSDGSPK